MKTNELARRYAAALFLVANENGNVDKVAEDLAAVRLALESDKEVRNFFTSPIFSPDLKLEMLKEPLKSKGICSEVINLLLVAVKKGRLPHLTAIANGYEELVDAEKGVIRGTVKSAADLSPKNRESLKNLVEKFVDGSVVLNYEQDASLIGGMIAEVGGWTFNDSIDSHLTRLQEDLKRSMH